MTTATSIPSGSTSAAHGRGVLLDEHLGRRQQRGLARRARRRAASRARPRPSCPSRRRRAAGAASGRAAREVAVDVAHAALLARRERERQRRVVALQQLAGPSERLGLGRARAALGERDLQQQQLLVGQAVARDARLLGRLRRVQRGDRIAAQRQPAARCARRPGSGSAIASVRGRCCSTSSRRTRVESVREAS